MEKLPDSGRLAGIITVAELACAGFSDTRIGSLVRRGVLVRVGRGIYARAAAVRQASVTGAGQRAIRLASVIAAWGPGVAGSHYDAASVHELAQLDRPPAKIAITRPPEAAGTHGGGTGVRLHLASLPEGHVVVSHRIPVTSVARTVIDIARTTSISSGVVTADSALHGKRTSKAELRAVIQACRRWPGIERAREVAEFCDGLAESPFESIARVAFRDGGLPAPELQAWVGGDGRVIGRADFLWQQHATIAEADGAVKYADPAKARQQLDRDRRLREAGFEVVHFTWRQIMIAPDQVVAAIRSAFRRASVLRAAGQ